MKFSATIAAPLCAINTDLSRERLHWFGESWTDNYVNRKLAIPLTRCRCIGNLLGSVFACFARCNKRVVACASRDRWCHTGWCRVVSLFSFTNDLNVLLPRKFTESAVALVMSSHRSPFTVKSPSANLSPFRQEARQNRQLVSQHPVLSHFCSRFLSFWSHRE